MAQRPGVDKIRRLVNELRQHGIVARFVGVNPFEGAHVIERGVVSLIRCGCHYLRAFAFEGRDGFAGAGLAGGLTGMSSAGSTRKSAASLP